MDRIAKSKRILDGITGWTGLLKDKRIFRPDNKDGLDFAVSCRSC
jgi:hypothetical protein